MTEKEFFLVLAKLMAAAGLVSAVFSRFRLPKAIGYILAGVLMSGHTWGGSFLDNPQSVQTFGQLGVVFLMFAMGLDFSASEMRKISGVTVPTAILDTLVMVSLGYTVGTRLFGWGAVPSLFLGAAICDSATTLLAKVIGELGWNDRPFVKFVLGTSICEDILCVGIIAVVTGVAQGRGMSVAAFASSIGYLGVFFLATLVFGFVVVPRLLTSVARRGDDESLLLTLLGCCFLVTYVAYRLNFSLALGAFLVGVLGSGSDVRRRLRTLVEPLKAMFAAVFFISIGLLVNPSECWNSGWLILATSALVIGGKFVNTTLGALVTGQDLKTALQMGMGLAQVGEFAFMVAMLYGTITHDAGSPLIQVAVGASLLTTVLNPLMLRLSEPVSDWAEAHCPAKAKRMLGNYRALLANYRLRRGGSPAHRRALRTGVRLAVAGVLEFAVFVVFSALINPNWHFRFSFFNDHKQLIASLACNGVLLVMTPLIPVLARELAEAVAEVLVGKGNARGHEEFRQVLFSVAIALLVVLQLGVFLMFSLILWPKEFWAQIAFLGLIVLIVALSWRFLSRTAHRASALLQNALDADERLAAMAEEVPFSFPQGATCRFRVAADSAAVGGTVVSLNLRARTGASVVSVEREGAAGRRFGPGWVFAPGDQVVAVGEAQALKALKELFGA